MKRKYNHKLIKEYKPYKGFYDLRDYDLPKEVFKQLEEIQYYLSYMSKDPEYYKKWLPVQCQKAQELSAKYQIALFQFNSLDKEYYDQAMERIENQTRQITLI